MERRRAEQVSISVKAIPVMKDLVGESTAAELIGSEASSEPGTIDFARARMRAVSLIESTSEIIKKAAHGPVARLRVKRRDLGTTPEFRHPRCMPRKDIVRGERRERLRLLL